MSPQRRNVVVGVVVLGGLVVLGWMILTFAGDFGSLFAPKGVPIQLTVDRADGISDGSGVYYRGMQVGRVEGLRRADDNLHIIVKLQIETKQPLPKNVEGMIRTSSALGTNAIISLELQGAKPDGQLSADSELSGKYIGLGLIPEEFTELATDIRQQQFIKHMDLTVQSFRAQSEKLGQTLDSINKLAADPQIQQNIRDAITNVRVATESADRIGAKMEQISAKLDTLADNSNATVTDVRSVVNKTGKNADELAQKLGDGVQKLGTVLDQIQTAATKANNGEGTAGKLLNDPKLYESLVDVTQSMNATVKDLQRLIQQWEQEGVPLKLR